VAKSSNPLLSKEKLPSLLPNTSIPNIFLSDFY